MALRVAIGYEPNSHVAGIVDTWPRRTWLILRVWDSCPKRQSAARPIVRHLVQTLLFYFRPIQPNCSACPYATIRSFNSRHHVQLVACDCETHKVWWVWLVTLISSNLSHGKVIDHGLHEYSRVIVLPVRTLVIIAIIALTERCNEQGSDVCWHFYMISESQFVYYIGCSFRATLSCHQINCCV